MNGKLEWDLKRYLKQSLYNDSTTYNRILMEMINNPYACILTSKGFDVTKNSITFDAIGDAEHILQTVEFGIRKFFVKYSIYIEQAIAPYASVGIRPRDLVIYAIQNIRVMYNCVCVPVENDKFHLTIML